MKIGVSLPCLDHSAEELAGFVAAAEHAGLDAVWNYEVFKNPFVLHALAAHMTERIELCIGLAANAIRSPYEMANAAIDVAGISHGRLVLGVGPGTAGLMDIYSGVGVDRPVARTREYLTVLKLAFEHLAAGTPASYEGTYQRFGTPTTMWGARADGRVSIPIYLGAVQTGLLSHHLVQRVGEVDTDLDPRAAHRDLAVFVGAADRERHDLQRVGVAANARGASDEVGADNLLDVAGAQ